MSNYYLYNKSNRLIYIQDPAGKILFPLSPRKCSTKAYSEDFIADNLSLQSFMRLGYVVMTESRIADTAETSKASVPGQKFRNGMTVYTKDRARLELVVLEYMPSSTSYRLRISKTGATIILAEDALSTSRVAKQEAADSEEKEDNATYIDREAEISNATDASVSIVRTNPVEAKAIDANDRILDTEPDMGKVDIVDSNRPTVPQEAIPQSPVAVDGDTFIVKSDNQPFAKEISEAEIVRDTQKEVVNVIRKAASAVSKPVEKLSDSVSGLTEAEAEVVEKFNALDARTRKMSLARMLDTERLAILAKGGDEATRKMASARLEKLNGGKA